MFSDGVLIYLGVDCCLDVEWLNEEMFASAGADQRIFIMHVDEDEPIKILKYVFYFCEFVLVLINAAATRTRSTK